MTKCTDCLRVIEAMGHLAPVGWLPFAWGPSNEDPTHYHVFPESEEERGSNGPEEVSATPICQLKNPVARPKTCPMCQGRGWPERREGNSTTYEPCDCTYPKEQ